MKPGWSMYLHEDKENFKNIIERVQDSTGRDGIVIEKDYYVAYEETIAQMMQIAEELEQLQNRYKELGIKDGICTKDI